VTEKGDIVFDKVIFATHFPIDNKHGMYFMKLYQHRSYVIAYEQAADVKGMYVDEAMNGMSFRNFGNLLLIGGGDHRTGKKGGCWKEIENFAGQVYPNAKEVTRWATQDCMSLDEVPYIGEYSKRMPGCFVATGFNKWGMTSSMVAAEILTDMVLGKENAYREVFNPARNMLRPQLLVNGAEAVMNLVMPAKRRCPHMGCGLKWNKEERSWDCPCHGSRFVEDGGVVDGPAMGDLE
jgi:glycine/D-amino acid oxidase-like deaminating enzyme